MKSAFCILSVLLLFSVANALFQKHGYIRREEYLMMNTDNLEALDFSLPEKMPPNNFITNQLDHFDHTNTQTYQQRYFVNDTFWDGSGPVFLYIEGEGAASPYDVLFGHHMEMAAVHNALVFAVEHRYYGHSNPTNDLSTPNLRWLSSQQALADLAHFHQFATETYQISPKSPWISFGGSYPGALSSWFRLKYPHLVFASVASSGPVRAKANFEMYNEVVATSLATPLVGGSQKCLDTVRQAFSEINNFLTSTSGQSKLSALFNTCDELEVVGPLDVDTFVENIAGLFQGTVQYNGEIPGALDIRQICKTMLAADDPLNNLAELVRSQSGGECMDIKFSSMISELQNVTVDPLATGVGARQWTYQTCTQFGYYQTCDTNTTCPFLYPRMSLQSNYDLCKILFNITGPQTQQSVEFSNDYYGALRPRSSRVLFVNGHIDPWHALSILQHVPGTTENAVFIEGTAHCANMQSSREDDPVALKAAHLQIENYVAGWIAQAQQDQQ